MAFDVRIPPNLKIEKETTQKVYKTYNMNFDTDRIGGKIDGIEALQQTIRKILLTQRYKTIIYSDNYGSEYKQLLNKNINNEYLKAELPRCLSDALMIDSRILGIESFNSDLKQDDLYVKFTVNSIYGKIEVEETL